MATKYDNSLFISKISTGLQGFDDLFYGGLRLPGTNADRGGICIVIYGDRGISKSDLAMQIMYGIHNQIETILHNKMGVKYYTLNHRESELKKKFIGLKVAGLLNIIKYHEPDDVEHICTLCKLFPDLRDNKKGLVLGDEYGGVNCDKDKINQCLICKLLRHEVVNYNDRSQTLHWTIGDVSDSTNVIAHLDDKYIETHDLFDNEVKPEGLPKDTYYSTALQKFKDIQKKIHEIRKKQKEHNERNGLLKTFSNSCIVIEGFTAFGTEELNRLPYDDLIYNLRTVSAVSILVFDGRGGDLHLNADIIIKMRKHYDESMQYMYHELHVEKSDLQQHVNGWQKYRKQRDLSVEIYPSIHSQLLKRFASSNAVLRMEQVDMQYPQSLLRQFQNYCAKEQGKLKDFAEDLINNILCEKKEKSLVYVKSNTKATTHLIEADNYDKLFNEKIRQELIENEDYTVVFVLIGKSEQKLREKISGLELKEEQLKNIHYWEVGFGCMWSEEFVSIIKRYITRWKKNSSKKHLHIIIDDFANINIYPFMSREPLLVPALVTICHNATDARGYYNNSKGVEIEMSLVCTSKESSQYRVIKQLSNY